MGWWSTPRPGRFTPWKETRFQLYRGLSEPHGRSGWCGISRRHRDSIPGPSSPQRVAIPTALSRPPLIATCLNLVDVKIMLMLMLTVLPWLLNSGGVCTSPRLLAPILGQEVLHCPLNTHIYSLYTICAVITPAMTHATAEYVWCLYNWFLFYSCSLSSSAKSDTVLLAYFRSSRCGIIFLWGTSREKPLRLKVIPNSPQQSYWRETCYSKSPSFRFQLLTTVLLACIRAVTLYPLQPELSDMVYVHGTK